MFGWFRKKAARLEPEARWTVAADGSGIRVSDEKGDTKLLAMEDLSGIAIETNDSGPWGTDLWLFFGPDDQPVCTFLRGATGEAAVIERIMECRVSIMAK